MELEGSFTVRSGRKDAYNFLISPDKITGCLPDVEEVHIEDENNFTVKAKVGVSFIRGIMEMKIQLLDKKEPESAKVLGKGSGLSSVVDMTTTFTLNEVGPKETKIDWASTVAVGGKLASFGGGGLLERVAKKNVEKFVEGVQQGISAAGA